jgi:hypothetical protein
LPKDEHEAQQPPAESRRRLDGFCCGEWYPQHGDHIESLDVDAVRHHRRGEDTVDALRELRFWFLQRSRVGRISSRRVERTSCKESHRLVSAR